MKEKTCRQMSFTKWFSEVSSSNCLLNPVEEYSPLFFRNVVEIERFALRAAILYAMSLKST